MESIQDFQPWEKLHRQTDLSNNRINPSPIILDFLSRNIFPKINSSSKEQNCLEVGVGIGRNLICLAEHNYCGNYFGLDHTDEALNKAKQLADSKGYSNIFHFVKGVAGEKFTFENNSFDFVFDIMAASTFIMGDNVRRAYAKEVNRILKPGGIFFVFTGNTDSDYFNQLSEQRKGSEPGTFRRSMDGTMEKSYTKNEILSLYAPLESIILESQSHYFRAFGEQVLTRPGGFWFGIFIKA